VFLSTKTAFPKKTLTPSEAKRCALSFGAMAARMRRIRRLEERVSLGGESEKRHRGKQSVSQLPRKCAAYDAFFAWEEEE
jgi:hypothetical protein